MSEKCTHETSICLAEYDGFYVCACTWGCGAALIELKLENHTVITFTAAELAALKTERDKWKANAEGQARYWNEIEKHLSRRPYSITAIKYQEIIEKVDAEILKEKHAAALKGEK